MQKEAWKRALGQALSGVATAAALDSTAQAVDGKKFGIPFYDGEWDAKRMLMALVNAGAGAMFPRAKGNAMSKTLKITGGLSALGGKDLIFNSLALPHQTGKFIEAQTAAANNQASQAAADTAAKRAIAEAIERAGKALPWVLGVGGLGTLGLGAVALRKYLNSKEGDDKAKLKLTLPGSPEEPDTRAELEMPVNVPLLSEAMQADIGRGARRMARKNIRANTRKQDPYTKKLLPMPMWQDKYGDEPLVDEYDQWRHEIEQKFGKPVKYASQMPPPNPAQPMPPPPATVTAPTPKGSTPMKQPVGNTPGPQLSSKYTQGADAADNMRRISKDLALGAAKLRALRERDEYAAGTKPIA